MRIIVATRPASVLERSDPELIWLDAREHTIASGPALVRLSPTRWRIVAALIVRAPCVVSDAELIEMLWGDDPEGGPLTADLVIRTELHRARRLVLKVGVVIGNTFGHGWSAWFAGDATEAAA